MLTARVNHPEGLAQSLNWWVVYVALPALVLGQIVTLEPSWSLLLPGISMWLVFFGAWGLMALVGSWLGGSSGVGGCKIGRAAGRDGGQRRRADCVCGDAGR